MELVRHGGEDGLRTVFKVLRLFHLSKHDEGVMLLHIPLSVLRQFAATRQLKRFSVTPHDVCSRLGEQATSDVGRVFITTYRISLIYLQDYFWTLAEGVSDSTIGSSISFVFPQSQIVNMLKQ